MQLILASSSKYRQGLLSKLSIPFTAQSPNIDESPLKDELPSELVLRLAEQKAKAIQSDPNSAWIIASDQVACFEGKIIGKPHNKPCLLYTSPSPRDA